MKIFLVGGFLGSGKTTAILQAALSLKEQGRKAGIITNDQGEQLVDTGFLRGHEIAVKEVTGSCFCCNFQELVNSIHVLREKRTALPDAIFAESVGSCTDLAATVANPLFHFNKLMDITISVFADVRLLSIYLQNHKRVFHQNINYIYEKQLEEADIIVVNKIDLFNQEQLSQAKQLIEKEFPGKTILYQSSLTGDGVQQWLTTLLNYPPRSSFKRSLELDYDKYADGEARLAWMNEEIDIVTKDKNAVAVGRMLLNMIHTKIYQEKYPIGHLKFLIRERQWYKKISFTLAMQTEDPDWQEDILTNHVTFLVNARVETEPADLKGIVADAIHELKRLTGCRVIENGLEVFQPGYPKPTHRMEYTDR